MQEEPGNKREHRLRSEITPKKRKEKTERKKEKKKKKGRIVSQSSGETSRGLRKNLLIDFSQNQSIGPETRRDVSALQQKPNRTLEQSLEDVAVH